VTEATQSCVFCKIARGELPANVVYQDEDVVAFQDIHPGAPTHILIVPRQHIVNLGEVDAQHTSLMGKLVVAAATIAREHGLGADGFRLVANTGVNGGQSVWHLHWHLLGGRRMSWPPG